jgi:Fic family protein
MNRITNITITPEILKLISELDEFKGQWRVIETLAPERLTSLRRIATIESVGSSTRIEGSKLSDAEVEKLLSGLKTTSFASRDEEEVGGYADAMDMIFEGHEAITSTENHIKQLQGSRSSGRIQEGDEPCRGIRPGRNESGRCFRNRHAI